MTKKNTCQYVPFNDLRPLYSIDEVKETVERVFKEGNFILGKNVEALEKEFCKKYNHKYAVAVGSGTDAITLSLMAVVGNKIGKVLTVSNSAPATIVAIKRAGHTVEFVDVDKNGLMDCDKAIHQLFDNHYVAVVPVHLYGRVCELDKLAGFCTRNHIPLIEDAAQAVGSRGDYKIGSKSFTACFSFYPTKNLGCYGDGGLIVTEYPSIYFELLNRRNYGLINGKLYLGNLGMNSRLDELQAAFLLDRMKTIDKVNRFKRKLAYKYCRAFKGLKFLIVPPYDPGCNYHLFPVFVQNRTKFVSYLTECGIDTKWHYPKAAEWITNTFIYQDLEVSLPNWYGMTEEQIEHVIKCVREYHA